MMARAWGARVEDVFVRLTPEPVAAASLGQVPLSLLRYVPPWSFVYTLVPGGWAHPCHTLGFLSF